MNKFIIVFVATILLFSASGCDLNFLTGDEDKTTGGSTPTVINLSGTWSGGGKYTRRDDGASQNMDFTLDLIISHQETTVTGSYTHVRPVEGTKNGPVSGTADSGAFQLSMTPGYTLTGQYTENTLSFTIRETFSAGKYRWIEGEGTVTRQ